jgi:outer membrane lipoprotein-sorting protein
MLAAWLAAGQPAQAKDSDSLVLDRAARETLAAVEAYLNGLQTLKADFTQVGPDGEPAEGVIYMRRPGLLRVEYAPPVPVLIVGDGFLIHYHDKELGQINDWFIYDTPLGALTREVVRFGEDLVVTAFAERAGHVEVTVVQSGDSGAGSLTLIFGTDPLVLRQWRVTDAQGLVTTVALRGLETNIALRPRLFVFDDPRTERRVRR